MHFTRGRVIYLDFSFFFLINFPATPLPALIFRKNKKKNTKQKLLDSNFQF